MKEEKKQLKKPIESDRQGHRLTFKTDTWREEGEQACYHPHGKTQGRMQASKKLALKYRDRMDRLEPGLWEKGEGSTQRREKLRKKRWEAEEYDQNANPVIFADGWKDNHDGRIASVRPAKAKGVR